MTKMTVDPALRQIIAWFRDSDAWDGELDLRLLQALWPRIAGPSLARNTSVVAVDGEEVVIRVPDLTWQQQLLSMRPLLLMKINDPWPGRGIKRLQFTYEDHNR
jgi:predicted nucleic acid-binding Zn ribbon protein